MEAERWITDSDPITQFGANLTPINSISILCRLLQIIIIMIIKVIAINIKIKHNQNLYSPPKAPALEPIPRIVKEFISWCMH